MNETPMMNDSQAQRPLAYARRRRLGTISDLPVYLTSCALLGIGLFVVAAVRADALLTNRKALPDPVPYAYTTFAWFGAAGIAGVATLVLWIVAIRSRSALSSRGLIVSGVASAIMTVVGLLAGWYVSLVLNG